jgi:hypothetical protein
MYQSGVRVKLYLIEQAKEQRNICYILQVHISEQNKAVRQEGRMTSYGSSVSFQNGKSDEIQHG